MRLDKISNHSDGLRVEFTLVDEEEREALLDWMDECDKVPASIYCEVRDFIEGMEDE